MNLKVFYTPIPFLKLNTKNVAKKILKNLYYKLQKFILTLVILDIFLSKTIIQY